jgi:predicted nucleic acid-binding protein
MVFLDANPVIYFVEQTPSWGAKAVARIATFRSAGEQLAVSDLVRMETAVGPLKANDLVRLGDFASFFAAPYVTVLPITATVCDRAAHVRAKYGFRPLDSLHLAAAVERGCTRFLTNDSQLKRFPDIVVDILT